MKNYLPQHYQKHHVSLPEKILQIWSVLLSIGFEGYDTQMISDYIQTSFIC